MSIWKSEDLYKILRNPKSPIIIGKKRDFKAYGIDLQFEDEALRRIAENAFQERTGARGLVSAVERVLLKFEHTLPSTDIRHLVVTPAMVEDPAGELQKVLENPDDPEREAAFRACWAEEEEGFRKVPSATRKPELRGALRDHFSDGGSNSFTRRAVAEPDGCRFAVEEMMSIHEAARDFARKFSSRNEVHIDFTEEAIDSLVVESLARGSGARGISAAIFPELRTRV